LELAKHFLSEVVTVRDRAVVDEDFGAGGTYLWPEIVFDHECVFAAVGEEDAVRRTGFGSHR
jgi:hypothetical protein